MATTFGRLPAGCAAALALAALATQISQGAPADVFASASPENMTTATDQNLTATAPK